MNFGIVVFNPVEELAFMASGAGAEAAGKVLFYAEYDPDGLRDGDCGRPAQTQSQSPAYIRHG